MSIVSQFGNTRLYGRHKEALDKLSAGFPKDAISILVELVGADPTNGFLCMDMGYALMKMGMFDKAIIAARQAIELDSTSLEAFLLLCSALSSKGDFKGANVALLRAIDTLRNPCRSEEDFLNQKYPKPLVICEHRAVFVDFTMDGDVNKLSLRAVTADKKAEFILKMAISGSIVFKPDAGYQQVGSGEIEKERLVSSLQPEVASVVKIFPLAKFGYVIFKKTGK